MHQALFSDISMGAFYINHFNLYLEQFRAIREWGEITTEEEEEGLGSRLEFKLLEDYSNTFTIPASPSHTHTHTHFLKLLWLRWEKNVKLLQWICYFVKNFSTHLEKLVFSV